MFKPKDYVFVLWSDGFDEMAATIFVSELREAGLLVQVVGLLPRQINGAHGLALVPDLTLDQALPLASSAICIIVPSSSRWGKHFDNDPRIYQLLKQAHQNQAIFVTGIKKEVNDTLLDISPSISENTIIYPDVENMVIFARKMVELLQERHK